MSRNRLILTPQRVLTDGLVCHHDLYFPNILLQSEDLTNASWSKNAGGAGSSPVITVGQADPLGGATAFRVQLDAGGSNGTTDYSRITQSIGWAFCVGGAKMGFWAKSNTGASQQVQSGLYTTQAITITTTWQFFELAETHATGTGIILLRCRPGSGGGDQTADVLIWHPQLYPSATLPPYSATTTLQSESGLLDLSGNGNHLTRGSNASAVDTNDPTVLGPGLGFDGTGAADDYAATGSLAAKLTLAGPWTLILAAKNTYAADSGMVGLGSAPNIYNGIQSASANTLKAISADAGGAVSSAGAITATDGTAYVLALINDGTNTTLMRLDDMSSCVVANKTLTGNAVLTLGGYYTTTGAIQTMTAYEVLLYGGVLSTAGLKHNYRAIKTKWAARPGGPSFV